jgi:hypothetical protein
MFRPLVSKNVVAGLAAGFVLGVVPVGSAWATDSLATPITGSLAEELWPIEVEIEILPLRLKKRPGMPPEAIPMPARTVVVADGHRVAFTSSVRTPHGQRTFDLSVVPRHHPEGAVELEWDLEVTESAYEQASVGEYLLHRLQLGPRPELDAPALKIARSDIVSTRGEPFTEILDIGGEAYEIRVFARSLRG